MCLDQVPLCIFVELDPYLVRRAGRPKTNRAIEHAVRFKNLLLGVGPCATHAEYPTYYGIDDGDAVLEKLLIGSSCERTARGAYVLPTRPP